LDESFFCFSGLSLNHGFRFDFEISFFRFSVFPDLLSIMGFDLILRFRFSVFPDYLSIKGFDLILRFRFSVFLFFRIFSQSRVSI